MTTLAAINKKIEQLKKQADAILQAGRREAIAKARDLIEKFELTADDLGLGKKVGRGRASAAGKAARPATVGTPKYRDPATGKTWTGVGRAPAWIASAKDRSKFLVDSGDGTASEADAAPPKGRAKSKASAAVSVKAPKANSPVRTTKAAAGKKAKRGEAKKAAASPEPLPVAAEQSGDTNQG